MEAPQFSVSSGNSFHATAGGRYCCFVPIAKHRAVSSTDGNGIAFRAGRTESGASVGGAAHALNCAIRPKAAIYGEVGEEQSPRSFARLSEICRALNRGFPMCLSRRKRRRKRESVNCHPSVGMGSGEMKEQRWRLIPA